MDLPGMALTLALATTLPAMAQSPPLWEIPPAAQPAGMRAYFASQVVGEETYACGRTDALAWAWLLRSSDASLADASSHRIGTFRSAVSVIPPPRTLPSVWQDGEGGRVTATLQSRGMMPDGVRVWSRYDVRQRDGSGPFTGAKSIVRISNGGIVRPAEGCDQSRSGAIVHIGYGGMDLFLK